MENLGASLIAIDRAIRIHVTVLVRTVIVAVHVAIRVDVAVEIGSITVHVGRVHIAASTCSRCPSREVLERVLPVFDYYLTYTV